MTRFSKSAKACGVQSEGENVDEVIIALCYRAAFMELEWPFTLED
jgi:hypothetical protein